MSFFDDALNYTMGPSPSAALPDAPVDAAGGAPGNYSTGVLDLFKFGIGAVAADKAQTNALDYQRFETTNGQLNKQGQAAGVKVPGMKAAIPTTTLLMIGGGVLLAGFLIWKFK